MHMFVNYTYTCDTPDPSRWTLHIDSTKIYKGYKEWLTIFVRFLLFSYCVKLIY